MQFVKSLDCDKTPIQVGWVRAWNFISSGNHPEWKGRGWVLSCQKVSNKRTVLRSGQSRADISARDAFLLRSRSLKNVLSSLSHKLTQAKPRQRELCAQWDVFFSLPFHAFQGLPMDSSPLVPFPDRGGLAGGLSRGTHFGRKVKGRFSGLAILRTHWISSGQVYDECIRPRESAALPRKSTDLQSDVYKAQVWRLLKVTWHACMHSLTHLI